MLVTTSKDSPKGSNSFMETLYWIVVGTILVPLVILLAFKSRRWAEKGNPGLMMFSIIFGLFLLRNSFLLLRSGGWANDLSFDNNLTVARFLANGWVDLTMNFLMGIALFYQLNWSDKNERKATKDDELCDTLRLLSIDPDALVELNKAANYQMRINIIVTTVDNNAKDGTPEWEKVRIYHGLDKKTLRKILQKPVTINNRD